VVRRKTGVFARSPLANPLGALTRPVARPPRLPADRPAHPYRPKIHQPKPRRTPPRAPVRQQAPARKPTTVSRSPLSHTPLQTLTRPIPQSGSFEAQHLRRAAQRYTQDLEQQVRHARSASGKRGGVAGISLPFKGKGLTRPFGVKHYDPRTRTNDQLLADLRFFHLSPEDQRKHVIASAPTPNTGAVGAGAAWTLEKVGRGRSATAGGIEAAIRHKDISRAAWKGLSGKEHKSGTDIFRAAGWKPHSRLGKLAQGAASFATDVVIDPATYVSGGVSSVATSAARNVALKAATRAAEVEGAKVFAEQVAQGAGRGAAKQAAKNAGKRAHAKTYENVFNRTMAATTKSTKRAPEIKVALPAVRGGRPTLVSRRIGGRHQVRATSLPARGAAKASARIERSKVGPRYKAARLVTREKAAKLNAQIRPAGMTSDEFRLGRQIRRERRAQTAAGTYRARQRAGTIAKVVQPGEQRAFGTAIEAGEHGQLSGAAPIKLKTTRRTRRTAGAAVKTLAGPERLKATADRYRQDVDEMHQALQDAGVPIGDINRMLPPKGLTKRAQRLSDRLDEHRAQAAKLSAKARKETDPVKKDRLRARAQNLGRKATEVQGKLHDVNSTLAEELARRPAAYKPRVLATKVEQRGPTTLEDIIDQPVVHGGTRRKPPQAHKRMQRASLDVLRKGDDAEQTYAAKFTENPALEYQAYLSGGHRALAQAESESKLFATARPVQRGQKVELGDGERLYHRAPGEAKLREIDHGSGHGAVEKAEVEQGRGEKGDYAVLNKAFHDFVQESDSEISNAWTRFQGGWKGWALKTPSYLMRNATGDLFNALGAQRGDRLAVNWLKGQRALKARQKAATGYQWFQDAASSATGKKTVTLNGREFTYDQLAMLAEATGAIDAGRLAEAAVHADKTLRPKGTKAWDRVSDRVENSARMGTFIGALERGMTPEKAADLVRDIHFDYGELTHIEKQIRSKALPFYTFSARNVPLQAKLLYQKPSLAANLQSAREEGRKQAGLPEDFWKGLDPYESKQLGVPIKFGNKIYTVSTGAPITDLSVLTPANPKDPASWLGQLAVGPGHRGLELLGPFKIVGELLANYSLFYGEPIKPDPRSGQANMTPVNPVVGQMAETLGERFRKRFGIEKQLDKTSGKEVWSWGREKEAAVTAALPGPFGAAYRATRSAAGPRGFSPATEALGTLAGVRAKPYDPAQAEATRLNNELNKQLLPRINIINNAGHNLNYRPTPELLKLTARASKIETRLDEIGKATKAFYKGQPNIPQAQQRSTRGPQRSLRPPPHFGGGAVRRTVRPPAHVAR
jgi:hypothetical protein